MTYRVRQRPMMHRMIPTTAVLWTAASMSSLVKSWMLRPIVPGTVTEMTRA